ncbi:MAG: hypothetical protein NTX50_23135, partial [Candidatus Sumerlaeota bacterium]|nr:hypothetical protein [Candidatus Sumerlaeota bacterium]
MKAKHTQTRTTALALMALLLAPLPALHADNPPALIEPADQAALTMSIPHFQWQRLLDAKPEAMPSYDIEIASDKEFAKVVDKDRIAAVIGWYVPDKELAPGAYWWRVAGVDARGAAGPWAVARTFSVKKPERVIEIKNNATFADIQKTFAEAAARAPVVVKFEKGVYRLDPGAARQFIAFKDVNDLTIDGGGATIVFTHPVEWVDLRNCRRVLVKNFILDFDPPAYTAGRVVAVDSKAGRIEAEILPGHALPDAWPVFDRDRKGMIVTESDGFAMKRDVQLVVSHAGFERLEGRRFRFRFENGKTAALFSIGDIYVLDPRWLGEGGGHGLFVAGGEDVVFFNLTIRSAA